MIVSNVCFGSSFVLYNAYLQLLADDHSAVVALPEGPAREAKREEVMSSISAKGYAWGYLGGLVVLIITFPAVFFLPPVEAYTVIIIVSGIWWLCWSMYTFKHLKHRPGPPIPESAHKCCSCWTFVAFSFSGAKATFSRMRKLPNTFKFVVLWFFYSDGVFVIGSVGVLMASTVIHWNCLKTSIGIAILMLEVPLFAGLGSYLGEKVIRKFEISNRNVVIGSLIWIGMIPNMP